MARGTVVGERVVSQANSKAYAENYERMFGKDHKPQRGRWSFGEADSTEKATSAPIMVDRFYEGVKATDGTDIGSRAKHRRYMKEHNLAPSCDFSPGWYEAQRKSRERQAKEQRRATVDRAFHDIADGRFKPTRRSQDE